MRVVYTEELVRKVVVEVPDELVLGDLEAVAMVEDGESLSSFPWQENLETPQVRDIIMGHLRFRGWDEENVYEAFTDID